MNLSGLLSADRVVSEMTAQDHLPAIAELVDHLVAVKSLPQESRDVVLAALMDREEQRSTGIGNGVAIPHCFSEDIHEVAIVFGRSTVGIEFCALDRAPVHFVVLFVVPKSQYTLHLKTLAAIAKILNSAETRENLALASGPDEILEVLARKTTRI
jgi:nitrogen PTS system EIIA component